MNIHNDYLFKEIIVDSDIAVHVICYEHHIYVFVIDRIFNKRNPETQMATHSFIYHIVGDDE